MVLVVAGRHQGTDEQPPIRLRRNDDVAGIVDVAGDPLMEPDHPVDTLRQPTTP